MIAAQDVVYHYPNARALNGVSFEVAKGSVLALVGPNGAGKSTLMRCIAALDVPTSGNIVVAGLDTAKNPRGVHAAIGYLPDQFGLYDGLSVRRSLIYAARSRGVPPGQAEPAAIQAAARVDLSDRLDRRASELSRGQRQRLAIAQTIVHSPQVLILDEPAAGLDPEARLSLSALIRRLAGEGMTIMVSSHILAELEDYCTEMLMITHGKVAGGGVMSATGAAPVAGRRLRVAFAEPYDDLAEQLSDLGLLVEHALEDEAVVLVTQAEEAEVLSKLVGAGLKVRSFAPVRASLEETYLREVRGPERTL